MFVNFISIIQNLKNTLSNYEKFILETEEYLHSHNGRIIEDLTAMEVGTTVIRVRKKEQWTYETYHGSNEFIPYLFKQ